MVQLLNVDRVSKEFISSSGPFGRDESRTTAVNSVSFSLDEGEVLGIVGESGSGKSTLARIVLQLTPATSGRVIFEDLDLTQLDKRRLRAVRQKMQVVFQDPYASLDPRISIGKAIEYPLRLSGAKDGNTRERRVEEVLSQVGLDGSYGRRLPHELSGGQRQRVCIARAIVVGPRLLVADEPVSALDLSTQAQVLNVFRDLRRSLDMAQILIAHDLAVARFLCDRILVMYAGQIVESAPVPELFEQPKHPYTKALLSASGLVSTSGRNEDIILEGDPPDPNNPPAGCKFHPRCPMAGEVCVVDEPAFRSMGQAHGAACHFAE